MTASSVRVALHYVGTVRSHRRGSRSLRKRVTLWCRPQVTFPNDTAAAKFVRSKVAASGGQIPRPMKSRVLIVVPRQ